MSNTNFNQIMKQAQEMQKKLQEAQMEQVGKKFSGISAGGKVSVTVEVVKMGSYKASGIDISSDLLGSGSDEDKEILEDLLVAAFNNAISEAEVESENSMSNLASMVGLPGNLKLPF